MAAKDAHGKGPEQSSPPTFSSEEERELEPDPQLRAGKAPLQAGAGEEPTTDLAAKRREQLTNGRFHPAQNQALAARLGRLGGNQALQRLIHPAPQTAPTIQRYPWMADPEALIAKKTNAIGNLDERALGRQLFDLAWTGPSHYSVVHKVLDALPDSDRDDVALEFMLATREENLDEFAASDAGHKMLRRLERELGGGAAFPQEKAQIVRIRASIGRVEAAAAGLETGKGLLQDAADEEESPLHGPAPLPPLLNLDALENRLRLGEGLLQKIERAYPDDMEVINAVSHGRQNLTKARSGLSVTTAQYFSGIIPESQTILERIDNTLMNLETQITTFQGSEQMESAKGSMTELIYTTRDYYLESLEDVFTPYAATSFNRAERVAAQLPRALTEVELSHLENRAPSYTLLEPSRKLMVAWVSDLRGELDAFEADAQLVKEARESDAPDLPEQLAGLKLAAEGIQLSIEALRHWDAALRAYEYLAGAGNIIPQAYGSVGKITQRCERMHTAAATGDVATLRARVKAHREDPAVETFFKGLPIIASSSQFLMSFSITLVAAMASAGIGGMVSAGLGTAQTTGGALLSLAGTAAIEALTFTAVSRGLTDLAPGVSNHGSALVDLAWNFGLFGLMRGMSMGIQSALAARGLSVLEKPLTLSASAGLLEGYGILRFRLEAGRWPTDDELAHMTAQNLIMLIGISIATRSVQKFVEARGRKSALYQFEQGYGPRFIALEYSRGQLQAKYRRALKGKQGADAKTVDKLRYESEKIENQYKNLVDEVRSDPKVSLAKLRTEMQSMGMADLQVGEALLSRSLGMPEEVGLQSAGGVGQYTFHWGKTSRVEARLREMGAFVVKEVDGITGLRTLTADFRNPLTPELANRPGMVFVERASPYPSGREVSVDVADPGLIRLLSDFSLESPTAQRFVVRLVEVELAKNAKLEQKTALKLVRKLLRRLEQQGLNAKPARTTEQEVLIHWGLGMTGAKANPQMAKTVDSLIDLGILKSSEWLSARTPQEFTSTVSEWLAYGETQAGAGPGQQVLRQVRLRGDLYQDAAGTQLRLSSDGKPRQNVDVVPELDLLTVLPKDAGFEFSLLSNLKAFTGGGAGDAASQNKLTLDALRAHQSGNLVQITTRSGDTAYAKVTEITALDPQSGGTLNLTGRLKEASGGAQSETVGPKQKRSSAYDRELSVSNKELKTITEMLRERQAMNSSSY